MDFSAPGTYDGAHSYGHLSAVGWRPRKRDGDREKVSPRPSVQVAQVLQTYTVNENQ
jgi:hypothetical protein